jgi:hypothetical protein
VIQTPVILMIFKRPDLTARVLNAIAEVKPRTLLVVADGPRVERPGEREACEAARAVIDRVDWDCDVIRNYSDVNLGCGRRPGTGITWAFTLVEEAIVLEDDTVPVPSFFRYCEELLARYRDDERVMHVAGMCMRRVPVAIDESYYFSQFNIAAGAWATWRRAWRYFDAAVESWPALRATSWLADQLQERGGSDHWAPVFDRAYIRKGDVSYWDHQWTFACWANSGLSVVPRMNLASNLGGGADATHMHAEDDPILHLPVEEMTFPLTHPRHVLQRRDLDRTFLLNWLARQRTPPAWRVVASRVIPQPIRRGLRQLAPSS